MVSPITPTSASAQDNCASNGASVAADDIISSIADCQGIRLSNDTIDGTLDFTEVQVRGIPIIITDSTVNGNVIAPNVTFADTFDLSGTRVKGDLNIDHATFQRDAVFSNSAVEGSFQAKSVRAHQAFNLASVEISGDTHLERAVLSEGLNAEQALFHGDSVFTGATFSAAVFVSRATFEQQLVFVRTSATSGADFRVATFNSDALFSEASIAGTLDLAGAKLFPEPRDDDALATPRACTCLLDFGDSSVGSLAMPDTNVFRGDIRIGNARLGALTMAKVLVDRIVGLDNQVAALNSMEDTARANGDTSLANETSFEGDVLKHSDDSFFWKWIIWWPFGEQIAGYLVKPLRPARAMLILAAAAALLRIGAMALERRRVGRSPADKANFRWWFGIAASAVGRASSVAINPKPPSGTLNLEKIEDIEKSDPQHVLGAAGLWAEWGVQKALNAVLIISLGNAVPGFKEVIDSILKR